jgi:uncharacterized protein (DUF736 family)
MAENKNYDNSVALWKNQKKTSDNAPAYTGRGMVNGKEVKAAAWINVNKKNENAPDFNIKFQDPDQQEKVPF